VRYRASPLVRGGQVAGAVVAFEDITRSKALLEREVEARQRVEVLAGKLRENEERYRRLTEAGIIGIVEWNASGALTEANDAFLQMLGYTREDLAEGRLDFRALTPPEHMAVTELAMRTLQETGVLLPFEKQYFRKDGSRVDILLSSATLDAERTRGIALVLDISERKAAEALVARQARYDRLTADVGLALTRNATRRASTRPSPGCGCSTSAGTRSSWRPAPPCTPTWTARTAGCPWGNSRSGASPRRRGPTSSILSWVIRG
jgi:PAS domain S-box-containing protein